MPLGSSLGKLLKRRRSLAVLEWPLKALLVWESRSLYVYSGGRTTEEAFKIIAENMVKKGMMSAIGGFVMTIAIAFGAGPFLASMAPVLITIGGNRIFDQCCQSDCKSVSGHS